MEKYEKLANKLLQASLDSVEGWDIIARVLSYIRNWVGDKGTIWGESDYGFKVIKDSKPLLYFGFHFEGNVLELGMGNYIRDDMVMVRGKTYEQLIDGFNSKINEIYEQAINGQ